MLTGIYEEGYLVDKDETTPLKALGTTRTKTRTIWSYGVIFRSGLKSWVPFFNFGFLSSTFHDVRLFPAVRVNINHHEAD
jgi:hypothetical protein